MMTQPSCISALSHLINLHIFYSICYWTEYLIYVTLLNITLTMQITWNMSELERFSTLLYGSVHFLWFLTISYICFFSIRDSGIIILFFIFFRHSTRKVHTLRPAVQAQSSYFTLTMTKKSIRSTVVKLASPHLVFAILAFGSGGNLHEIWSFFSSLGA